MEYRAIAGIGDPVSRLCFGCEQLGGTDWGVVDEDAVTDGVRHARNKGINFFDTADVYGLGRSEERLAQALGADRHDVIIGTKVGVAWTEVGGRARTATDCSPGHVRSAVEGSLRRLRLERIPLLQVHRYDPAVPLSDTLEELERLRADGKIGAVGYSNFPLEALRNAHALLPAASYQLGLNLLNHREASATVEYCRTNGIAVLAYGVLAQGLLSGKYGPTSVFDSSDRRHRLPDFQGARLEANLKALAEITAVARLYDRTSADAALRWVLQYPGVTCAIVGVRNTEQVERNLGAMDWQMEADDWSKLTHATGSASP